MMRVSRGCRSAMRRESGHVAGRKKHHGKTGLLGRRPEPVRGAVREPCGIVAREGHSYAEHARLLPPFRQQIGCFRIRQRNAPHDGEAIGIAFRRLQRIVVVIAGPARRDDDDAIDTGLVHQRQQFLDRERLGKLRHSAGNPGAVGRFRLPQVDLRIDDHSALRRQQHLPARRRQIGHLQPRPRRATASARASGAGPPR